MAPSIANIGMITIAQIAPSMSRMSVPATNSPVASNGAMM
jgi:hypothetical protein